jgi:UDP-N-acetylglucosamine--N-acetylmuramyl-(pentapeptide) pyrophosphoryl-undecaprenol N-acetylglucosamine transferase
MRQVDFVLVGGGSGGHLTPLIPVAESLHKLDPSVVIVHIGHKGDPLNKITRESDEISDVYEVSAGKLRRYYGESWVRKVFDVKTNLFNLRDLFRFATGAYQSWRLLGTLRPKAIMMKGGYVCAGVGVAARLRKIPYMTHDSDAMVSLAHKLIAKGAAKHATAMPPEFYKGYDTNKTIQVGVPIKSLFHIVSTKEQQEVKRRLGFSTGAKVVLVTGGGQGAQVINEAFSGAVKKLLEDKDVQIVHLSGGKLYADVIKSYKSLSAGDRKRIKVEAFTSIMHEYSAAADIIVTRASATALAEFAAQSKACIIVPSPFLAGGHQLRNAEALEAVSSVRIVHEDHIKTELLDAVIELLADYTERQRLGVALHKAALPGAADRLAAMLVEIAR